MHVEFPIEIFFSLSAGISAIVGEIWYNYSIYSSKTRPDRLAWWVLSLSGVMFTGSHFALGGIWTAVVPSIITIGMVVTSILSISRGDKLDFNFLNILAFLIAITSMFIWWYFHEPRISLFANITVNTLGMALCIRKTYLISGSEPLGPWVATVFADVLNIFAIGQGSLEWVVPINLLAIDGLMLVTVIYQMDHGAGKLGSLYRTLRSPLLDINPSSWSVR